MMKLRAPAYPLITVDPFFSVWSMSDRLTESDVKTWFGRTCYLLGIAEIDGVKYTFMGDAKGLNYPAMTQACVDVDAFSTVYTFKAGGVVLKARFTTPVLPDNIDVFTKPISSPITGRLTALKSAFRHRNSFAFSRSCKIAY